MWDLMVNGFLSSYVVHHRIRKLALKWLGCEIGRGSSVHSKCLITGNKLNIGRYSYVNRQCLIDAKHAFVYIGDYVGIAYNAKILTTCHKYGSPEKRTGEVYGKHVNIGCGCWIGAGAIIYPGVTIGKGCVIASGSIVINDCEENCLYGGSPAKKIRHLERE